MISTFHASHINRELAVITLVKQLTGTGFEQLLNPLEFSLKIQLTSAGVQVAINNYTKSTINFYDSSQ